MLASFVLGAYAVYSTSMGAGRLDTPLPGIPLLFIGLPVIIPFRPAIGDAFAILWTGYLSLFAVTAMGPKTSLGRLVRNTRREGLAAMGGNGMFAVASTFSALIVLTVALETLQETVGIPTGSIPHIEELQTFFYLSLAPFVEEIGFRLSITGLVAYLILVRRGAGSVNVFWNPGALLREKLDPEQQKTAFRILNLTIGLTSVLFGLAHILYGGGPEGWQLGKVSLATLAGLAMGWIYVYYGFPSAVMLHWSFNYFLTAYYVFEKSLGITLLSTAADTIILLVGFVSLAALAIKGVRRLRTYRHSFPHS